MPARGVVKPFAAILLLVLGALGGGAAWSVQDSGEPRHYDAREARRARVAAGAEQLARETSLRREHTGLIVHYDEATGVARSVYDSGSYLTGPNVGADPLALALEWAEAHRDLLGLGSADLAHFEVTDDVYSEVGGTRHLYLRQVYKELPLYNTQLHVNFDRDLRIVSVNNSFLPDVALAVNTVEPRLDAGEAVASAARHLGDEDAKAPAALAKPAGADRRTRFDSTGISKAPIEARLMILPIERGEARLVWNFQIATADDAHVFDFTVDAVTGEVWTRFDWVASDSYQVYRQPVESPNHVAPLPPADGRVTVVNPHHPFSSPFRWHDTNGVVGAEFTIMRGNNVHAYDDLNADFLPPAIEPNCGVTLSCVFPINLAGIPQTYTSAAVANLFYWNNLIHDVQFLYGFNSPAGNFQANTYGAGGVGTDYVRAQAQDTNGGAAPCPNNAFFGTPPEPLPPGQVPRMRMCMWTPSNPDRDGDLDSGIIVHEYGHGISNRLVGGPGNVGCLANAQQPGEGLSDWWALAYTHEVGDLGTDGRGIGTYALNQPITGLGIRTQRYSTNPAVNTWTYASIAGMAIPHGVGSVWAQGAWEAYWELVDFWGFDPNLYNPFGGAGNQRMMLYVNEGLKFTACSPTFLQVRDGIIQAATVNYGGIDVCRLWVAFARFGMGSDALPGPAFPLGPTNGFSVPAQCRTDAWSKDKPWDTGLEPDPATAANNMWESEDIWVRNDGNPGPHQNPEFGQLNHVWAKIRNRSGVEAVNLPVKLYWADASTALLWPMHWNQIGTVVVGSLPPGGEVDVSLPWNPPGTGHFCLLSRIDSVQDPMTFPEGLDVNFNTRFNNNIVWKNVNIVDLVPFQAVPVEFIVRNVRADSARLRLRFREPEAQRGDPFVRRGKLVVTLDDALAERWKVTGQEAEGVKPVDDKTFEVDEVETSITVEAGGREEYTVVIHFEDLAPRATAEEAAAEAEAAAARGEAAEDKEEAAEYRYEVVQEDAETGEVVGGITYVVRAPKS